MFKNPNENKLLKVNKLMYYGNQFLLYLTNDGSIKIVAQKHQFYIKQWIPKQGATLSFMPWWKKVKVMIFLLIHLKMLVAQVMFTDYIRKKINRLNRVVIQPHQRFELWTPGLRDQCSNPWGNEALYVVTCSRTQMKTNCWKSTN